MLCYCESGGVIEVGTGRLAGLARFDPLLVMAAHAGDERFRLFEVLEIPLGQQEVFAVIRQQHAFVAGEQHAVVPLRYFLFRVVRRLPRALIPGDLHRRQVAALAVFICGAHRSRRDLRIRRWTFGLDREWMAQIERPERQVVPVTAQVGHGAAHARLMKPGRHLQCLLHRGEHDMTGRLRQPIWVVPLAIAGLVAIFGWWGNARLRQTIEEELKEDLAATLNANVTALEIWTAEQEKLATILAEAPRVRALAIRILEALEQPNGNPHKL